MNQYEVKVTEQAEIQIHDILHYISVELHNPDASENLLDAFENHIEDLEVNPERYPVIVENNYFSEEIRWFKVKNFLMYFWIDVENSCVHIIGVVYEKRDQKKFLQGISI